MARKLWMALHCMFALVAVGAAIVAVSEWQQMGDMRLSWASNSLIAAGVYLWVVKGRWNPFR